MGQGFLVCGRFLGQGIVGLLAYVDLVPRALAGGESPLRCYAPQASVVVDCYGDVQSVPGRRIADCNGKPCGECDEECDEGETPASDQPATELKQ